MEGEEMIKLIAIDLDGTLLDSDKKISNENIKAIQTATKAGIKIVICTGRPKSGVLPYFEKLGLNDEEYIIMNNGCTVYNTKDWELLNFAEVDSKELERLGQTILKHPQICLTVTGEKHYYAVCDEVPDLVQYDGGLVFDTVVSTSIEELKKSSEILFQAMFMGESEHIDIFQAEQEMLLSEDFSVVRSQDYIFEVMPKGYTKATALEKLANRLGYSSEEIMAIGDAANDIEMLDFAYHSVAMGNASTAIQDSCRYVTTSNDHAGVAKAIYDYVLS